MMHPNFQRSAVLALVLATACTSDSPFSPGGDLQRASVISAPVTVAITVAPGYPQLSNVAGIPDFVPGFGAGSIGGAATASGAKSEVYLPLTVLFGRAVTLSDVASLSYWTKTGAPHTADPRDWALVIYTEPFTGDVSTPVWYGARFGAEPYFASGLNDPAGEWNQWVTGGGVNELRFYESTAGAPGANFGAYTDPNWRDFVAANSLGLSTARSEQVIKYIVVGTGSAWAAGFTGQVDGLVVELTDGSRLTVNFEQAPVFGSCLVDENGTTYTLLADCTTSQTLLIPDGYTLDGNSHTITAVDPAGGHFLGAVVKNAGAEAHVTDLTVTTSGLANVCDGGDNRLRGILFDGASGSITDNTVVNVNQGMSGCQEGNAVEVRNAPFDNAGPDVKVQITGNVVSGYLKTGILANGSVAVTISDNAVAGYGPLGVPYAAQNGVQVGYGATAIVKNNMISGNDYTPKSYVACGLLLFEADGVKAAANTFSGNEKDVCNYGKGGGNFNPLQ